MYGQELWSCKEYPYLDRIGNKFNMFVRKIQNWGSIHTDNLYCLCLLALGQGRKLSLNRN